ncbi:MAG: hypothetical protein AMK74_00135 [Nitrospira bacterium SM23_35]|nr:MAG: hypothetical protein AMK74_00135 [Nitrospira bacterium SM23_35]
MGAQERCDCSVEVEVQTLTKEDWGEPATFWSTELIYEVTGFRMIEGWKVGWKLLIHSFQPFQHRSVETEEQGNVQVLSSEPLFLCAQQREREWSSVWLRQVGQWTDETSQGETITRVM